MEHKQLRASQLIEVLIQHFCESISPAGEKLVTKTEWITKK